MRFDPRPTHPNRSSSMHACAFAAAMAIWTMQVLAANARAAKIVVELPENMVPTSATLVNEDDNKEIPGKIDGQSISFDALAPDQPYTARVELKDGTILQGVNLNWHSDEPEKEDAGPITDDDKKQILAITNDVKSFYNINEIIQLRGSHDRAVALARVIRDIDFYANKGGEIVWRIEIWYFKFQYGGWEKVQQSNKILRRERFRDRAAFDKETKRYRYVPELGGLVLKKDETEHKIKLTADAGKEAPPVVKEESEDD